MKSQENDIILHPDKRTNCTVFRQIQEVDATRLNGASMGVRKQVSKSQGNMLISHAQGNMCLLKQIKISIRKLI